MQNSNDDISGDSTGLSDDSVSFLVSDALGLFYCNSRSLLPKIDELRCIAATTTPNIIAVVETWLDSDILESELTIPGYIMFRNDRSRHGGGVAFYISDTLHVKCCSQHDSLELLSIVVNLESGSTMFTVYYRPPSSSGDLGELENALHQLNIHSYSSCILLGDFNIDLLRDSDPLTVDLLGRTSALGLHQIVEDPTRYSSTCNSLIDHLYVSNVGSVLSIMCSSPLGTSDHCSLSASFNLSPPSRPLPSKRKIWLYSKADFDKLNDELSVKLASFDSVNSNDINSLWSVFKEVFMSEVSSHIPSKTISSKKSTPWFTKRVRRKLKARDRAHKRAKQLDTPAAWSSYRHRRNQAVGALRDSKQKFISDMSGKLKTLKNFWTSFHSISKVHKRVPSVLSKGDISASDDIGKATLLNDHFVSCFAPPSPLPPPPPFPTAISSDSTNPPLDTLPVSSTDVMAHIRRLKSCTASGPDGISSRMLKGCAESICEPLSSLFNQSLSMGVVPNDWKLSSITPIHKSGDPALAKNYRPISLLSLVSKILERVVHEALLTHVLDQGYLSPKQFGFRPGSSTAEAILAATRDWHDSLERSSSVACVFFRSI